MYIGNGKAFVSCAVVVAYAPTPGSATTVVFACAMMMLQETDEGAVVKIIEKQPPKEQHKRLQKLYPVIWEFPFRLRQQLSSPPKCATTACLSTTVSTVQPLFRCRCSGAAMGSGIFVARSVIGTQYGIPIPRKGKFCKQKKKLKKGSK